eukprot:m.103563 g.103563  ORF g.103563 m.103563 type:complete len:539 (-) comp27508_c0_seq1:65-1681(-)
MVRRSRFVVAAAVIVVVYFISQNIHVDVEPASGENNQRHKKSSFPDIPNDPIIEDHANVAEHAEEPVIHKREPEKDPEPEPEVHDAVVVQGEVATVTFYEDRECAGATMKMIPSEMNAPCSDSDHFGCTNLCSTPFTPNGHMLKSAYKSVKVTGRQELDLYEGCGGDRYWGSVFELDGCTNIYDWPPTASVQFVKKGELEETKETFKPTKGQYKYRIVYSAESSTYFAYQAQSSYWGFKKSKQNGGGWTRLITSHKMDDLSKTFPTFSAKRHPFSRRYGPINKGDVIAKWYASPDRPTEEVLVVVDPDNWMVRDLSPYVNKVSKGHALGQEAWYAGARSSIDKVWKKFCLKNCDFHLDLSAVPYFVHRDDLEVIAPLWKYYSLKIKEWLEVDPSGERQYGGLQIGWCAEMYGYNFAAAHAGVVHEILPTLQLRDVGPHVSDATWEKIPMIHIGRIWFPKSYGCKTWCHTEGRGLSGGRGDQVWCKCNITGSDVIPWPKPQGMDHVSETTLDYLHDSREFFGDIPVNDFRPAGYHVALP